MSETLTSDDAAAVEPLRLTICPSCDYSLEGSAREGICPECGERFDSRLLIFRGTGPDRSQANTWTQILVPLLLASFLFIIVRWASIGLLLTLLLYAILWSTNIHLDRSAGRDVFRLWLCAGGYEYTFASRARSRVGKTLEYLGHIGAALPALIEFAIKPNSNSLIFILGALLVGAIMAAQAALAKRFSSNFVVVRINDRLVRRMLSWSRVESAVFTPIAPGITRLTLVRAKYPRKFFDGADGIGQAASIDVEMNALTRDALAAQIRRWWHAKPPVVEL